MFGIEKFEEINQCMLDSDKTILRDRARCKIVDIFLKLVEPTSKTRILQPRDEGGEADASSLTCRSARRDHHLAHGSLLSAEEPEGSVGLVLPERASDGVELAPERSCLFRLAEVKELDFQAQKLDPPKEFGNDEKRALDSVFLFLIGASR